LEKDMKKILTLVMVLSVIGSVIAGCGAPAAEGETKTDATKVEETK